MLLQRPPRRVCVVWFCIKYFEVVLSQVIRRVYYKSVCLEIPELIRLIRKKHNIVLYINRVYINNYI